MAGVGLANPTWEYSMPKDKPLIDPDEAIRSVRSFLEGLHARDVALGWQDDNILMGARGPKVLTFTSADRSQFYRCLTAISRAAYHWPLEADVIRGALEDAIFAVLDGPSEEFPTRLDEAIKRLRAILSTESTAWRIAFRIQWIEPTELPFDYRGVHFVPPSAEAVKEAVGVPETKEKISERIEEFLRELREGVGVAIVEVEACDVVSARALALERVHLAVDELTGFAALVYPRSIPVIADVYSSRPVSLATVELHVSARSIGINFPLPLPSDIVRPQSIFAILRKHAPEGRVNALLEIAPGDELTERILACARYIGRAQLCAFQHRTADAFLYFIVSLEALLGKSDFRDTIGYQLRMRVAHLIGHDLEARKDIDKEVVRLYDLRSKMVHTGTRQVRALDFSQARGYAVQCLGALLFAEPVNGFLRFRELEDWYRDKLLG